MSEVYLDIFHRRFCFILEFFDKVEDMWFYKPVKSFGCKLKRCNTFGFCCDCKYHV